MSNSKKARPLSQGSGLRQRPKEYWGMGRRLLSNYPQLSNRQRMTWLQKMRAGIKEGRPQ